MQARFTGKCLGGGHDVAVGDEIVRDGYGWSHPEHLGLKASPGAMLARDLNRPTTGGPSWTNETEWALDSRLYREAKARLSPSRRERWAVIEAAHEWFDGEDGLALGALRRWLAGGDDARRTEAAAKRTYEMEYAR